MKIAMFDVGWSEMLVIGLVALVVVGPKELPALMRTIGGYIHKIKQAASSFQTQFQEAIDDSEISKLRDSVDEIGREFNPDNLMGPLEGGTGDYNSPYDEFGSDEALDVDKYDPDAWNKRVLAEEKRMAEADGHSFDDEDQGGHGGGEPGPEVDADLDPDPDLAVEDKDLPVKNEGQR